MILIDVMRNQGKNSIIDFDAIDERPGLEATYNGG
jgi:hypothetical protein